MIKNPTGIIGFLLFIEISLLIFSSHAKFKRYFRFLPSIFWIYFLPMLASTFGILDSKSPILPAISTYLLPSCLFLLLLSVDFGAILRLGKTALIMFFSGSLGIMIGIPLVFFLFKDLVGRDMWSSFGALSASWIGGSANLIAVKEALGAPDQIFMPIVIVDTIVPYFWMGILVSLAGLQVFYDRWNRSDRAVLEEISGRIKGAAVEKKNALKIDKVILIIAFAILGGLLSLWVAQKLPTVKDIISTSTWVILIASLSGIAFSFSPARRLEEFGASRVGYFMLFFVLTSLGARANLSNIGSTAFLVGAGFLVVLIHATVLIVVARMIKAPMFLVATASQANIGGVASAPIVAEIYEHGLASVGLLMAILGNITGTYLGIAVGQMCRWIAAN